MAVTKHHVGFALVTGITSFGTTQIILKAKSPPKCQNIVSNNSFAALEPITNGHHFGWTGNFVFVHRRSRPANIIGNVPNTMSADPQRVDVRLGTYAVCIIAIAKEKSICRKQIWLKNTGTFPNTLTQIFSTRDTIRCRCKFAVLQSRHPTSGMFRNKQRIEVVFSYKFVQSQPQLSHVIGTLNPLRPSFGLSNRRQQERRENSYNGNDQKQFNQSES